MPARLFNAPLRAPADAAGGGKPKRPAKNVILVHGAWADGSSWLGVIERLQAAGLTCTAVQNPLTRQDDDVAAVRRAIDQMDEPTVLVGHSYRGVVISEAGVYPTVTALVYVAAMAPEPGEAFQELAGRYPPAPGFGAVRPVDTHLWLDREGFAENFCQDLPAERARALAAAQGPVKAGLFDEKTSCAAWRGKPSYYAVSTQDRMIAPELQRFYAERMGAETIELDASHASPLSRPQEIAELVLRAARAE